MAVILKIPNNVVDPNGGSTLLIEGSGFTNATEVYFHDGASKEKTPARSFKVVNDTEISVVCPAFTAPSQVYVFVIASDGTTADINPKQRLRPSLETTNIVLLDDQEGGSISDTIFS